MDNNDVQLVGGPCGHHGPYTFYKAFKYTKNGYKRIVTLSEFFFVKMWRDSDLLCIGELQLLWIDKNSEQMLASLRLYFLPENTPDGRMDHGEDEVLAISEKVVIKLEDLITWITVEAEWNWGRLAKCAHEMKEIDDPLACAPPRKATGSNFTVTETHLDYSDVENERKHLGETDEEFKGPHVIILSFPKYCRYRAMMKRLEGVEDVFLKHKIVNALGGFYVKHPNTRVLFCKDTFDYPELEGHELLCNHLAPKLKGRPRGKRKKRSVSPCSESNESECSVLNTYNTREIKNGMRLDSGTAPRRSTRCHENNENKEFIKKLGAFMKSNRIPMGRIPSLGYKELNLYEFYTKVQKLGGYDCVTTNRLWKSIFDDISGHQNSTSAATVIRRHYERFLLQYERHIRGEEYKPLSVMERRRLKTKRGSSFSDETESSSGTSTPTPSTSRKIATTENKENTRTEGKTSSLRSIRVKPDRQKEKQANAEKEAAKVITTSNSDDLLKVNEETENVTVVKPKVEKLLIKTESVTVKTECSSSLATESPSVKKEYAIKNEQSPLKGEKCLLDDNEDLPLKMLTKVKVELEIKGVIKSEVMPVKTEETPIKQEPSETNAVKTEPISVKPEKSIEPVTTAVTPVAQKINTDNLLSPMEGKENIPLIKTGDTPTKSATDGVDIPYKPQIQLPVTDVMPVESDTYKSTFIHEVKKRKLDILKEGGLEVTPVRTEISKDRRPSVIQQISPPLTLIPKTITTEVTPVPVPKRTHIAIPQSLNISHVKAPVPSTPTKNMSPSTSYPFLDGSTPPKVVQSKSIYSYSEKTVYGNPKDILYPALKETVHTPKFISTVPRQSGGDPVDLSVNSPQKPIVEIMRVPQTSSSPYNRGNVTKNLYKSAINPLMDGRMLGSNLEITLVNPKQKKPNAPPKPYNYPSTSSSNPYLQQKRLSAEYNHKVGKSAENGRFNKPAVPPSTPKNNMDLNIPHPFKRPSAKPDLSQQMKLPAQQPPQPNMKHFLSNPVAFPPYLSQLYEQAAKGIPPTYIPLLDPTVYYTAAMQSLYANSPMNSAPVLPLPTPDQLKLYTELMAHGRMNFPFPLQPDEGSSLKKP